MKSLRLRAPAKLNLYLKVVNKRPDGYHNLITLFERIDLYDDLEFRLNPSGRIRLFCRDRDVPTGPRNLVYRVARRLKEDYGVKSGVDIRIIKRIPVAAGLAGGSTNAATALMGLSRLWKINLTRSRLISYGKSLGADVPFFLYDCSWGLGTERGDKIRRVPIKAKLWHILVVPRVKMRTPRVFQGLKLDLTKDSDNVNILIHNLRKSNSIRVGQLLRNDLEHKVFQLCPSLKTLKNRLRQLDTPGVALSGSGPSIFGLTDSKKKAEQVKAVLKKRYSRVYVVRTL